MNCYPSLQSYSWLDQIEALSYIQNSKCMCSLLIFIVLLFISYHRRHCMVTWLHILKVATLLMHCHANLQEYSCDSMMWYCLLYISLLLVIAYRRHCGNLASNVICIVELLVYVSLQWYFFFTIINMIDCTNPSSACTDLYHCQECIIPLIWMQNGLTLLWTLLIHTHFWITV